MIGFHSCCNTQEANTWEKGEMTKKLAERRKSLPPQATSVSVPSYAFPLAPTFPVDLVHFPEYDAFQLNIFSSTKTSWQFKLFQKTWTTHPIKPQ